MQTLTVEITDESALKVLRDLEDKHFIKIITSPHKASPALPGNPMNPEQFQKWIADAEKGETMNLQEAKEAWQKKYSASVQPRQLKISKNAYQNILDITHYIAVDQQAVLNAQKVSDKIFATIMRIGENPFAAKECEYISTKNENVSPANLSFLADFYKVTDTEILILGVLHQANNPSNFKALKKIK